jgi:Uma2 family endonuclease
VTINTSGRRPPTPYSPPLVSWEDFHDWALRQEHRVEWVDGEIIELMPDSIRHFLVARFLSDILRYFAERPGLDLVLMSAILMRLPNRPSGREPDVMFVSNDRLSRLTTTYLDGPSDLAVEVVSPDSETRDRRDKLREYEATGVREYWLIDEPRREARFYVLDAEGSYRDVRPDGEGIYVSAVLPDLRLRVDWLWRETLPIVNEALTDLSDSYRRPMTSDPICSISSSA